MWSNHIPILQIFSSNRDLKKMGSLLATQMSGLYRYPLRISLDWSSFMKILLLKLDLPYYIWINSVDQPLILSLVLPFSSSSWFFFLDFGVIKNQKSDMEKRGHPTFLGGLMVEHPNPFGRYDVKREVHVRRGRGS